MDGYDPTKGLQSGGESDGGTGGGKGKKGQSGKPGGKPPWAKRAPATQDAVAAELRAMKSKALYCAAFQKGTCRNNEGECPFAHLSVDSANEVKGASQVWRKD